MKLKIVCSGFLVRYPLGGHSWHQLQYLVGLQQLGHEVVFFEHYGWEDSCFDVARNCMTSDAGYGLAYLRDLLRPHGLDEKWCYLAEGGTSYGMTRQELARHCHECDLYINLDNINWIPELETCRRRVTIDVDPVFTQIGGHGLGGPFEFYDARFTYGENVHRPDCTMPDGNARWKPTRQPIVPELWPFEPGNPCAPFTTVMNWTAYGDKEHEGRVYGQKDREFTPFFMLPLLCGEAMELAVQAPPKVREQLCEGGWRLADPLEVSRDPWRYQEYLSSSRAEFCVAKHAYASTHSGWFSDRSAGYLASGRPVVVQDTGFSDFLPCGAGLLPYSTRDEALSAIAAVNADYPAHCRAARRIAEECFGARRVLGQLIEESFRS